MQLAMHNTLEELIEAQQIAHLERLASSQTGRSILDKLRINYHKQQGPKVTLTREIRSRIKIPNLPKSMHPEFNQGRRTSRAKTELKVYGNDEEALFVDAAEYSNRQAFTQ